MPASSTSSVNMDDLKYLPDIVQKNWLGRGEHVAKLKEEFAAYLGVGKEHIVLTNSCTEAMFQIMEYLSETTKQGHNDVLIPTISFIGAANAVKNAGFNPILTDVVEP